MKKGKYIIILFLILLFVLKITGALRFYKIPTSGNEPNMKLNSYAIGSDFIQTKKLDFGCYLTSDEYLGEAIITQRLIAEPGDLIESKNGELYVNNINIDKDLNLRRFYEFTESDFKESIYSLIEKDESLAYFQNKQNNYVITLDEDFVKTLKIPFKRFFNKENTNLSTDLRTKNKNSDFYNFGPIKLPEGKYFFVGDNRDNSLDSRIKGFVDVADLKGSILYKF